MTRPILLALPLLGMACDDRVDQCNALVERLNPHTNTLVRGVENLARIESNPDALGEFLTALDAADKDLATLQLADEKLAGFALRYRRQLGDARTAAEAMDSAAKSGAAAKLNAAAKQADGFLDAQATILDELNAYCAPPAS